MMNILVLVVLIVLVGTVVAMYMKNKAYKAQLDENKIVGDIMRELIETGVTIEMISQELSKMPQEVSSIIIHNMNPKLIALITDYVIRQNN